MNTEFMTEEIRNIGKKMEKLAEALEVVREIGRDFGDLAGLMEKRMNAGTAEESGTVVRRTRRARTEAEAMPVDSLEGSVCVNAEAADRPGASEGAGNMGPEQKPQENETAKVPEKAKPAHGFEEVRGLLAKKAVGGFREQVKELLDRHGLKCLSEIAEKPELFDVLYAEAEAIGVKANGNGAEKGSGADG